MNEATLVIVGVFVFLLLALGSCLYSLNLSDKRKIEVIKEYRLIIETVVNNHKLTDEEKEAVIKQTKELIK
ncbi:MAG: hypothetical protein AB7E76_02670 [Deferribacterales bacterium]